MDISELELSVLVEERFPDRVLTNKGELLPNTIFVPADDWRCQFPIRSTVRHLEDPYQVVWVVYRHSEHTHGTKVLECELLVAGSCTPAKANFNYRECQRVYPIQVRE